MNSNNNTTNAVRGFSRTSYNRRGDLPYIGRDMASSGSSKAPTPISHLEEYDDKLLEIETHMEKMTLDEEKVIDPRPIGETISAVVLSSHIPETLRRLLDTFEMTGHVRGWCYKSPDGFPDVEVDMDGNMQFLITNNLRYDIQIPLLMSTLSHVHHACMAMRIQEQRALSNDKHKTITSRCLCIDPFEVSWAIQIHLFKMHKMGIRCVVMGVNNTLFVDKNILLLLVRDSLTRTYMTKENAYWAFNTIATVIAKEW